MSLESIIDTRIRFYENKVDEYIDIREPNSLANTLSREYYRGKWDAYREFKELIKKRGLEV